MFSSSSDLDNNYFWPQRQQQQEYFLIMKVCVEGGDEGNVPSNPGNTLTVS